MIKPGCQHLSGRSLCHAWHLSFCSCKLRDGALDHLALIASGSRRTVVSKRFLNRCGNTPLWLYSQFQSRGSRQKFSSPIFSLEGPNYIFSQLLSEGLASNQLASMWWPQSSPLGHWRVLAYPLMEPHKNKDSGLDDDKNLRDNQKVTRLIDDVHLIHTTNLFWLREMAVLSNLQKTTQRVKENEETGIC